MSDSSIVNSLVDEFQCHICYDLLDDPRPACTWGHVFCRNCLEQLIQQNARDNRPARCPICRAALQPDAVQNRVLGDQEGYRRTTRVLEQLRRRVIPLPPREVGVQTDPIATASIGHQTDIIVISDDESAGDESSDDDYGPEFFDPSDVEDGPGFSEVSAPPIDASSDTDDSDDESVWTRGYKAGLQHRPGNDPPVIDYLLLRNLWAPALLACLAAVILVRVVYTGYIVGFFILIKRLP